jgi:hypothetical protein
LTKLALSAHSMTQAKLWIVDYTQSQNQESLMTKAWRARYLVCRLLLVLSVAGWTLTAIASNDKKSLDAKNVGHIEGVLLKCGQPVRSGLIFTPGFSYLAKTNASGEFLLAYVQPGSYTLKLELDGDAPFTVATNVSVITDEVTGPLMLTFCRDQDMDGFDEDVDCDDRNPAVNPGAAEICDLGIDNDCDGDIDDGCPECTDADFDGFYAQQDCGSQVDCNDSVSWIRPGAPENCDEPTVDANCDGDPVDDCLSCTPGASCETGSAGVCAVGLYNVSCECIALDQADDEICDGLDNNCNSVVDEGGVCDVDCVVSEWSAFSQCSNEAGCGTGTRTRTRSVVTYPEFNGDACPVLEQTESCELALCPVHCQLSEWSEFSACSAACGGGTSSRTRNILQEPANGGTACGPTTETVACNEHPCPVDCTVSEWTAWGACSVTCGDGMQTRTRSIIDAPQYGGQQCPELTESRSCNTQPCPVP